MAGSMMSGRLVAPMMNTFFLLLMPSISVRIWLITRSAAPPASPTLPPRALAMESSSSKKSTQGAAALALSKTSRTLASDSPNHMVSSSGPLMEMKLAWHSLAMALASRVLPQPGGP
uniref:Putative secreted protein n=1 Tax=Ixodes ricinus TaxID=34613 RepID=A0A6B0ULM7_IXORI